MSPLRGTACCNKLQRKRSRLPQNKDLALELLCKGQNKPSTERGTSVSAQERRDGWKVKMKGREGTGEERKRKRGRKEKRREKERERAGKEKGTRRNLATVLKGLMDYGEDRLAKDQGEVRCVLRYRTKQMECLRPRQVKQYSREAVSQELVLKDGKFSRNRVVTSRGRQQHLEQSGVMEKTWGC